jgi:DNA-binding LytR/AlgR family response regulator
VIGGHLIGFMLGSAAHIAGMTALRHLLFPLFGETYRFGRDGQLGLQLLYEARKDAVIYLSMVALIWLAAAARRRMTVIVQERIIEKPVPAVSAARLEIRDGAKRIFVDPADILWAEAAGNYVELHLRDRSLLQRQTLAALEDELTAQGFVRIHRSRLVNRHHLRDVASQSSGDFTVTLSDGRQIAGSRRWRASVIT